MKLLLAFLISTLLFTCANSSEIFFRIPGDSLEIKKWTKEDFIKEFGINDSAKALINLFFIKNHRGKSQTIIGGAFLIGGIVAWATPFEHNDDAKNFGEFVRPAAEPGVTALGAILTTSGIIKLKRYSLQKLYSLLSGYKKGAPIPIEYKKRLKQKFFFRRYTITPRF